MLIPRFDLIRSGIILALQTVKLFCQLCNFMFNIFCLRANGTLSTFLGVNSHIDVHPHDVTVLVWPREPGLVDGSAGTAMDSLLIGRNNGSVEIIDVFDVTTLHWSELCHCSRKNGKLREPVQYYTTLLTVNWLYISLYYLLLAYTATTYCS